MQRMSLVGLLRKDNKSLDLNWNFRISTLTSCTIETEVDDQAPNFHMPDWIVKKQNEGKAVRGEKSGGGSGKISGRCCYCIKKCLQYHVQLSFWSTCIKIF